MYKENNIKQNNRPKNIEKTLPIVLFPSINKGQDYSDESVYEACDQLQNEILPWINVPVKASRSLLTGDPEKKGIVDIGYLISYEKDIDSFVVGFYGKYAEFVKTHTLAIKMNVIAKDNVLTKFTTFEVIHHNVDEKDESI